MRARDSEIAKLHASIRGLQSAVEVRTLPLALVLSPLCYLCYAVKRAAVSASCMALLCLQSTFYYLHDNVVKRALLL
jgi:hypothetical protein